MSPDYEALKQAFNDKTYILTAHASDRAVKRNIRSADIEQAIGHSPDKPLIIPEGWVLSRLTVALPRASMPQVA